jgi:hypothetical protein
MSVPAAAMRVRNGQRLAGLRMAEDEISRMCPNGALSPLAQRNRDALGHRLTRILVGRQ